ncbi:PAS domain-containing protein, partial [Haladaptatus sp.]|uniref:PAS domain-containing protein n=1 Tax=Haladaptatus sp. TaxID=1973141 RepID=UPI003C4C56C1
MATEQSVRNEIYPGGDLDAGTFWRHAFEGLVTRLPEPVFVVDEHGTITYWNSGAEELTGYSASRAVGMPSYELFGTDGQDETLAETVVRTGQVVRESDIRTAPTASGGTIHGRALAVPITTPDGETVGAVEVITRVTELIEQREAVRGLQQQMSEEVEGAVAELRDSAADVAEDSQSIRELTR